MEDSRPEEYRVLGDGTADECSEELGVKRKAEEDNELNCSKKVAPYNNDEKKSATNLRKNIRDVIDENQLDSITLAAQREESERLARVNEQQKVIREFQRQSVVNRQVARAQSKVLSLLQSGNTFAKEADITTCYSPEIEESDNVTDSKTEILLPDDEDDEDIKLENDTSVSQDLRAPCEIVTIDDSSDDDCILLSDEEIDESIEEEEDDSNNSGMHVKDIYNTPDEQGRVVVNIGHTEGEEDIYVAPQIARIIKPHQIGGVRFLFDNIIESTSRFKSSSGFGCILAHSMGLGKTMQVVCFCDLFMRHTPSKTILCVMPINTIQNWFNEFNIWTPRHSENENLVRPRTFDVFVLNDQQKTLSARAKVIKKWSEEGGVLLIGYELFRLLALKISTNRRRRNKNGDKLTELSTYNKNLYDDVHKALVKPGPDLVICDEGHRIKNSHAGISLALKQIRTRRRIVLTGYPLQNNLLEYWCMVDFVRPNYLGTRTEFCNMFERPIQNGQCIDSTPGDIKLMRYRAHVLHSLLVGFVQRRSHVVLQETLPEKQEYVILTKMTKFQRELYKKFMTNVVLSKVCPNPLKAFAVCCKIWNHPDVLYNFLKKRQADLDLEIDEVVSENSSTTEKSVETNDSLNKKNPCSSINNKEEMDQNNESFTKPEENKRIFFGDDYLQRYSSNEHEYWKYPNSYDPCTSIQYSTTPNYIGTVKETVPTKNVAEENGNSSEIVDLDTQEIKTVSTCININKSNFMETNSENILKSNDCGTSSTNTAEVVQKLENIDEKDESKGKNEDGSVPYDWAKDLMANYSPGLIESSPKMEIVFYILKESIEMGDRILLFSQSLLTLNLIEQFLEVNEIPTTTYRWAKGSSYFRLDGSTSAQERERLVNEFNSNPSVKLFLISTRAGSLGINLIGANRVIIFDASWNPCHDTQAVYRVYRFGQKKPCFIYRIVMDRCLEKKIYDRQIKKQGMSNRVVDECNPESHLSIKDVSNLCHNNETDLDDDKEEPFTQLTQEYGDDVIQKIVHVYSNLLSKEPFHHESLLLDRKERKLSQAEKRLAHRGYEAEKKSIIQKTAIGNIQYRMVRTDGTTFSTKPTASVRPMQTVKNAYRSTRWIPAEVWQRQGMTAQEMTLPLDVVIPTNSSDKTNIILKAGQRVMVLKSTKGIYMQLESGKIIAIRTASKSTEGSAPSTDDKNEKHEVIDITADCDGNTDSKDADSINSKVEDKAQTPTEVIECNEINETNSNEPTQDIEKIQNTSQSTELSSSNWLQKSNTYNQQNNAFNNKQNESWQSPPKEATFSDAKSKEVTTTHSVLSTDKNIWSNSTYPSKDEDQVVNAFNASIKTSNHAEAQNVDSSMNQTEKAQIYSDMDVNQSRERSDVTVNTERIAGDFLESRTELSTQPNTTFPSFANKETKSYDYPYYNKQYHTGFLKPPLYPAHQNNQRYLYNTSTTLQNSVPPLNEQNSSHSYLPGANFNTYPMNFYDNYNTNTAFVESPNQHHRPYVDYPSYGNYGNTPYQQNYSSQPSSQNIPLSSSTTSTSSFKPYNFGWPNHNMQPSTSPNACNSNYSASNSNGSDVNRWPN